MEPLIRANLAFLDQADELLARNTDASYARPCPGLHHASVGAHLRHCLEHYRSFLDGLPAGRIDYDDRARDESLERFRPDATAAVADIRRRLREVEVPANGPGPGELLVRMDCGLESASWQRSTPGRELQFLVSHTVHHFAMIAGICRDMGIEPGQEFGVAPSTLRHRRAGSTAG